MIKKYLNLIRFFISDKIELNKLIDKYLKNKEIQLNRKRNQSIERKLKTKIRRVNIDTRLLRK